MGHVCPGNRVIGRIVNAILYGTVIISNSYMVVLRRLILPTIGSIFEYIIYYYL